MGKKRFTIVYFCFEGFSKLGAVNNHVKETVSNLSKFGHGIHLFIPCFAKLEFNQKFNQKIYIHRIPLINTPIIRWIVFDILSLLHLITFLLKNRADFIYFRETSSITPLLISKLFSIPIIIEVNGWVVEELKFTNYENWKISYIQTIQKINFLLSDRIVTVSEGLKHLIINRYRINPDKIIPIRNGTNPEIFKPIPKSEARERIGIDIHTKIAGFIGSCYPHHGIHHLISASPIVLKRMPDIKFIIAGDGVMLDDWKRLTEALNVHKSFVFTGAVPLELAPFYINAYDICLALWDIDLYKKTPGSPMKLFDYLACSKPVVTSPIGSVKGIIEKYNCGILVDPSNGEEVADSIIHLFEHPEYGEELGRRGREAVVKNFTWEITSRKIEEVAKQLLR